MKHCIISLLALACIVFAKVDVELEFNNLSSHIGDTWTIRTFGAISKYKVAHAYVISNTLTIKWNTQKGRMSVKCDGLCNEDDEFFIRMFDKDSLLIDFAVFGLTPNQYLSSDEYIIPSNVRKDIAYMEIVPSSDDWKPEYVVMCQDGYTLDSVHTTAIKTSDHIRAFEMIEQMLPLVTTCTKQKQKTNDYGTIGSWKSESHDCPPSWQDEYGNCKPGW